MQIGFSLYIFDLINNLIDFGLRKYLTPTFQPQLALNQSQPNISWIGSKNCGALNASAEA